MFSKLQTIFIVAAASLILTGSAGASVIFKPGEKAKYLPPGEEEINGNAQELFRVAQEAEAKGNIKRALTAYRLIVRKYPRDALAAGAGYRSAQLQEQRHDYIGAAEAYRWIVISYPRDTHFAEAIEAQFRIGEMYLNGRKIKLWGVSVANALDKAVDIFAAIIRTAPYGKYTARAQFDIGLAREKEGANDAALQAYEAVVDKFPSDPVAVDAQYQIGYIWFTAARAGTKDFSASEKARIAFQDFLFRFPNSEKAAQARANLDLLQNKQTSTSFRIAQFYDKQRYYRAAVIYYNEVIRQQPGSAESEKAKRRIDELKAKVGEAALQPLKDDKKDTKAKSTAGAEKKESPGARGSSGDVAPLPAAEPDASASSSSSFMPDGNSASSSSSPDSSPTDATPEASASPAP